MYQLIIQGIGWAAMAAFLIYDFPVGSWGGMASEAFTIISIIISIIISVFRFGWKNLTDSGSEFQN